MLLLPAVGVAKLSQALGSSGLVLFCSSHYVGAGRSSTDLQPPDHRDYFPTAAAHLC